jgi:hypothetical protein
MGPRCSTEKIMTDSNNTSRLVTFEDHDTLEDTKLRVVSDSTEYVITKLQDVSIGGGDGDPPVGGLSGIRQFIRSYGY